MYISVRISLVDAEKNANFTHRQVQTTYSFCQVSFVVQKRMTILHADDKLFLLN